MDNMLLMMEKYTNNLEELVEQKTQQYKQEKKKADILLNSMMPVLVIRPPDVCRTPFISMLFFNVTVPLMSQIGERLPIECIPMCS